MDIKKTSWHYRLFRFTSNITKGPSYLLPWKGKHRNDPTLPSSLCPYTWSVFLSVIGALVILLLAAAAAIPGLLGYGFVLGVGFIVRPVFGFLDAKFPSVSKPAKPVKIKHESLIKAYIKAQKARACPTIQLVD